MNIAHVMCQLMTSSKGQNRRRGDAKLGAIGFYFQVRSTPPPLLSPPNELSRLIYFADGI